LGPDSDSDSDSVGSDKTDRENPPQTSIFSTDFKMVVESKAPVTKKSVTSTIPKASDADDAEEAYDMQEESKEAASQDIDDFERRLNGEKMQQRPAHKAAERAPLKMVAPPLCPAPKHIKVKSTSMTEEEEDRAEALKAVSELSRFEEKLGK
jgi:hypothetical protein